MNCAKKNKGRCVNCPEAEVFPQATNPKKKLVMCKMKPEMQTPIELPDIPDDQGVAFINETT